MFSHAFTVTFLVSFLYFSVVFVASLFFSSIVVLDYIDFNGGDVGEGEIETARERERERERERRTSDRDEILKSSASRDGRQLGV